MEKTERWHYLSLTNKIQFFHDIPFDEWNRQTTIPTRGKRACMWKLKQELRERVNES